MSPCGRARASLSVLVTSWAMGSAMAIPLLGIVSMPRTVPITTMGIPMGELICASLLAAIYSNMESTLHKHVKQPAARAGSLTATNTTPLKYALKSAHQLHPFLVTRTAIVFLPAQVSITPMSKPIEPVGSTALPAPQPLLAKTKFV